MKESMETVWKELVESGLLDKKDTSVLLYSFDSLRDRLNKLKCLFENFSVLHTVAIKTNPEPNVLKEIRKKGFGLEAASFEEVLMAIEAGVPPDKIIYNSPVKTNEEIEYCSSQFPGIRINANSLQELERLSDQNIINRGLRINPVVQPDDNGLYNVSGVESKFGVPIYRKKEIIDAIVQYNVSTLHVHIGSAIQQTKKAVRGIRALFELAEEINNQRPAESNLRIHTINIGGGIPAGSNPYESERWMENYVNEILEFLPNLKENYTIVTEFGQWIHKFNGTAFSVVEYVKELDNKCIAYIHLGADMFVRQVYSPSENLNFECISQSGELINREKVNTDIAGPLCFNGDYVAKNILLPQLSQNDIVAIKDIGANCFGLWSRHCSRTIPKIIGYDSLVSGKLSILAERNNPFLKDFYSYQ